MSQRTILHKVILLDRILVSCRFHNFQLFVYVYIHFYDTGCRRLRVKLISIKVRKPFCLSHLTNVEGSKLIVSLKKHLKSL